MLPKVSICIPVYNGEDTILRAINSALNQSYKNLEIMVSDNCSTDQTMELIQKKFSNQINIFKRDKNYGMYNNFLFAVENATGEYVLVMGADDELAENCIERLVEGILKNSSVAAFCKSIRISGTEKKTVSFNEYNTVKELIKATCSSEKINYLICGLWKKFVYYETVSKLNPNYVVRGSSADRLFVFFALYKYGINYYLCNDILFYKYYQKDNDRTYNLFKSKLFSLIQCVNMILTTDKKFFLFSYFFTQWIYMQMMLTVKSSLSHLSLVLSARAVKLVKRRLGYQRFEYLKSKLKNLY